MGGKHYLTGPVILVRTNMDGRVISLTIDEVYLFQKYLASHSITLICETLTYFIRSGRMPFSVSGHSCSFTYLSAIYFF